MGSYFYGFIGFSISNGIYENSYLRRSKYTIFFKTCRRFEFLTVATTLIYLYSIIVFICILYILEFSLLVYKELYLLLENINLSSLKLLVLCEYWPETAAKFKI